MVFFKLCYILYNILGPIIYGQEVTFNIKVKKSNNKNSYGSNVHYFMHKYNNVNSDWSKNINLLHSKDK